MNRSETVRALDVRYVCSFRPEPEGGYTVRCAAFPEIVTYGFSLDEARANAREAIELCLEVYEEEGKAIPASDIDPEQSFEEVIPVTLARA